MGYGIVMGLVDQMKKKPSARKTGGSSSNKLEKQELLIILNMMKESAFQGKDVETVYNIVVKLQNQLKNV